MVVYLNVTAGSAELGLAKNYEQNRVQILALRDFVREIRPKKFTLMCFLTAIRLSGL